MQYAFFAFQTILSVQTVIFFSFIAAKNEIQEANNKIQGVLLFEIDGCTSNLVIDPLLFPKYIQVNTNSIHDRLSRLIPSINVSRVVVKLLKHYK